VESAVAAESSLPLEVRFLPDHPIQ
jgi:hypothetical protein